MIEGHGEQKRLDQLRRLRNGIPYHAATGEVNRPQEIFESREVHPMRCPPRV